VRLLWRRVHADRLICGHRLRGAADSISGVGFLFDQTRPQRLIDALFDGGPLVVFDVHGAGQFDKARIKLTGALFVAEAIFDIPQPLVDCQQRGALSTDVKRGKGRALPAVVECRQFGLYIGKLAGIGDAPRLDVEDGELVDQFAR